MPPPSTDAAPAAGLADRELKARLHSLSRIPVNDEFPKVISPVATPLQWFATPLQEVTTPLLRGWRPP